jgi:hypothetical protein
MALNIEQTFAFDKVLFFGRNLAEYCEMFNLEPESLVGKRVLDCPSGPASFVAEANAMGINAIGCDPLYENDIATLTARIETEMVECLDRQAKVTHLFDPDKKPTYPNAKMEAFRRFADDFAEHTAPSGAPAHHGRYLAESLPSLPFEDNRFDLAVSGNFLFLYSDYNEGGMLFDSPFDYQFHLNAILEFLRVAKEIRMYPIKGPHKDGHAFVKPLVDELRQRNFQPAIIPVKYRDVIGAHDMLVVK